MESPQVCTSVYVEVSRLYTSAYVEVSRLYTSAYVESPQVCTRGESTLRPDFSENFMSWSEKKIR